MENCIIMTETGLEDPPSVFKIVAPAPARYILEFSG